MLALRKYGGSRQDEVLSVGETYVRYNNVPVPGELEMLMMKRLSFLARTPRTRIPLQ